MAENRKEEYFKLKIRIRKRVGIIVGCVVLVFFLITLSIIVMSNQGYFNYEEFPSMGNSIIILILLTLIIFFVFLINIGRYFLVKKQYVKSKFGIKDSWRRAEQEKQQQSQQVIIQQPSASNLSDTKSCIHCGYFINTSAQFCEKCGKEQ